VAVVPPEHADRALGLWQALPEGDQAAIIGELMPGEPQVVLRTELGGQRLLEELEDDPLPRIC
jgi:hydrogenase expression/formation protein HypE